MTRQRNDNHSTEFGLWLRQQKEIDSKLGFVATNIDYLWENYRTGEWMLIEEKRFKADLSFAQGKQLRGLHEKLSKANLPKFKGMFLLQFENTTPEDGRIWLNRKEITKDQLIKFLQFNEVYHAKG